MALRKILNKSDEILHKVCKPVTEFDDKLGQLLDDMTETLKNANGVGLAGPQVAKLRRVVVIIIDDKVYELINPEIVLTLVVQCAVIKGDVLDIMRDLKIHFSKLLFKLLVAQSIAGKIHKPCCFDIVTK